MSVMMQDKSIVSMADSIREPRYNDMGVYLFTSICQ
jgi:hypothetical protein